MENLDKPTELEKQVADAGDLFFAYFKDSLFPYVLSAIFLAAAYYLVDLIIGPQMLNVPDARFIGLCLIAMTLILERHGTDHRPLGF